MMKIDVYVCVCLCRSMFVHHRAHNVTSSRSDSYKLLCVFEVHVIDVVVRIFDHINRRKGESILWILEVLHVTNILQRRELHALTSSSKSQLQLWADR